MRKQLREKMFERIREVFHFISSVFYTNQDTSIYRLTKMEGEWIRNKYIYMNKRDISIFMKGTLDEESLMDIHKCMHGQMQFKNFDKNQSNFFLS